jgi:hypothetical protein
MMLFRTIALFLLATACAAASPEVVNIVVSNPIVLSASDAQQLFDDAIRWSRAHQMETGGCFSEIRVINSRVIVFDAREVVIWRRRHATQVACSINDGIWHTHWQPEDSSYVGCNMSRAADRRLIGPDMLGLVICGVGRDSVIPYTYSYTADSSYQAYGIAHPDFARRAAISDSVNASFTCADEPEESLRRPRVLCRQER